jgi:hypothetical protein
MSSRQIRVQCVDDHRILRDGLELIISQQRDMKLVASAATGEESVELFRRHRRNPRNSTRGSKRPDCRADDVRRR